MRLLLAALALVSMASFAADGSQWMWRDASGQLHASDLPPPGTVPDKDILARPVGLRRFERAQAAASAASSAKPAASGVDPELEARRRRATEQAAEQQRQQQRQQQAKDASVRAENCTRATLSGIRAQALAQRGA